MAGDFIGALATLPHPDHGEQGGKRKGDEEGGELVAEELDLVHEKNNRGREKNLNDVERCHGKEFAPFFVSHVGDFRPSARSINIKLAKVDRLPQSARVSDI